MLAGALGLAAPAAALNFSQYPRFEGWRSAERSAARLPDPGQRAALRRHRPRFLLPPGHPGLVDFYRDYVANATLVSGDGEPVAGAPGREDLNRLAEDPRAVLAHRPPSGEPPPGVVYARADRVQVPEAPEGRDGPPGATYNTVPALKPLDVQLFAGYWREGSRDDLARYERLVAGRGDPAAFARAQRRVFFNNLACLRERGAAFR